MDDNSSGQHGEIHLPSPSAAPIIVAAGLTLVLTGILNTTLLIVGVLLLAIGIGVWAFGRA